MPGTTTYLTRFNKIPLPKEEAIFSNIFHKWNNLDPHVQNAFPP